MRRLLVFLLTVAVAISATGCLSHREDADPQHLAVPDGGVREYVPVADGYERTPLFIGMTYGQALSAAGKIDFSVYAEDAADEDRNPHYDSWTVVSQEPSPGESTRGGARLKVLPNTDAGPLVTAALAFDPHLEEERFTGVVAGYGENGLNQRTVVVDRAEIQLDMVAPISGACDAGVLGVESQRAKERVVPIGANVLVVMSEEGEDRGFLHPWPEEVEPPAASINEMLVRSGWWQPDGSAFDGGFEVNHPEVASVPYTVGTGPSTGAELIYAPLIAAAGSEGNPVPSGWVRGLPGHCGCRCRELRRIQGGIRQAHRGWEAKYQRRVEAGYYTCRDGDGDGFCNED